MTGFVIGCAAMLIAALVWITLPLWRPRENVDLNASRRERRISSIGVIAAVSVTAVAMYAGLSNWNWKATEAVAQQSASIEDMLSRLEARLAANPNDVDGWLLLGRSNVALQRFAPAVDAYQHAYDLTRGENLDAVIGLGESLALLDETSLAGRAGELFNVALARSPNNPKALWYGSVAALQTGNLRLGHDRLQSLLAQNPPPQLRDILQRQIQALDEQLADETPGGVGSTPAQIEQTEHKRSIHATISIAPAITQQLKSPTPLFILARDPAGGGPPLAVQRHSSAEAPLSVELSEADAMVPSRSIATVPRVKVVARLSLSGAPQEHSGDFYGEADYDFSKDTGTLQILIDRTVP